MARPHGRCPRGERLRVGFPHGHWKTTTLVGALTMRGLIAPFVLTGPINHHRGPRRSFEAVEYATPGRVDWFSNRRLFEPIGNIPPAEADANFYGDLETDTMTAKQTKISLLS